MFTTFTINTNTYTSIYSFLERFPKNYLIYFKIRKGREELTMLEVVKSITGVCWQLWFNGVMLETRCKKYEINQLKRTYERRLRALGYE